MKEAPPPSPSLEEAKLAKEEATKLLKAKQYSRARAKASVCLELEPDNADCILLMGLSYASESAWSKAEPYYIRFLRLAPDHRLAPRIRDSLKQLKDQGQ